jgi:hypothetical protein
MSTRAVPKKGRATRTASLKRLRKELDRLWQRYVVERAGGWCELCQDMEPKAAYCGHHVFTKASSLATRWDPDNGVAVCHGCHIGCHGSRYAEFLSRIQELIGMELWDDLRTRHRRTVRLNADTLQAARTTLLQRPFPNGGRRESFQGRRILRAGRNRQTAAGTVSRRVSQTATTSRRVPARAEEAPLDIDPT